MNNTTTLFKLQHPEDLISRLFILEYIKDLGVDKIKNKLTEGEIKFWLYSFEGDNTEVQYDFNWEYLLFVIPLLNLGKIMERYIEEIEDIEARRQSIYTAFREAKFQEELAKPVDINVYDLAQTDIKNQSKKLD